MILFRTTDAADAILADSFRDGEGSYMFVGLDEPLRGVFVGVQPVDVNDGANGDQVLEVTLPDDLDISEYAMEEEGLPVWEYLLPAALINEHAQVRLLAETYDGETLSCGRQRPAASAVVVAA